MLYCDDLQSEKRKICTNLLALTLDILLKWFAPILSFTTEEIFSIINKNNTSIHLEKFTNIPSNWENKSLNEKWTTLKKIRDNCNISIEEKRASKEIGSSLEAELKIKLNSKYKEIIKNIDLSELCITSKTDINFDDKSDVSVETKKALGDKCPVCWKISVEPCERHSK